MQRRLFLNRLAQSATAVGLPGWMGQAHAADEGLTAQSVTIGSSLSLTGILAGAGVEHTAGIKAAFATLNQAGGVHGRELRLLVKDDAYSAPRALDNVRQMVDTSSVFALMSLMGTATTAAALPLIELHGVPCVGPVTGASSLRSTSDASHTPKNSRIWLNCCA
jgi:ABC-type branched-subunit amino acid transport system substrate-binding protein